MALSSSTFSAAGGAVDSLFSGIGELQGGKLKAQGIRLKAQGDLAEASEYDLAGKLALQNEEFTKQSTAIKQMQSDRELTKAMGETSADISGAGFGASGSALDLLRDSASQGALNKAVLGQQGLITEAGYQEQSDSYTLMSSAARTAAAGEFDIANKTEDLSKTMATGSFISGAIKGVAAIASIAAAPFTGGLSLAALPAVAAL
jgi:hypothetical protein